MIYLVTLELLHVQVSSAQHIGICLVKQLTKGRQELAGGTLHLPQDLAGEALHLPQEMFHCHPGDQGADQGLQHQL